MIRRRKLQILHVKFQGFTCTKTRNFKNSMYSWRVYCFKYINKKKHYSLFLTAIPSTSTFTPRGNFATSKQDLAGYGGFRRIKCDSSSRECFAPRLHNQLLIAWFNLVAIWWTLTTIIISINHEISNRVYNQLYISHKTLTYYQRQALLLFH